MHKILITIPDDKEEYIIEKDGQPYDTIKHRSKAVSIVNELFVSRKIINLLKQRNTSILSTFNAPGLTYIHKGNKSKELKKIPLLEAVISELKSESAPYSLFEDIIKKLNPSPLKLLIDSENVPYSSSFDTSIKHLENFEDKFIEKIERGLSPESRNSEKCNDGKYRSNCYNYAMKLPPRVIANMVYYCAVPPIEEAMEKHLRILSKTDRELFNNTNLKQKELLEKLKKIESGEFTSEIISSPSIKRTYPLTNSNTDKLMVYSVIKDMITENKTVTEISEKLKLPVNVIEIAIMAIDREYKAITHKVPEIRSKDYIQKRDSTCYRIAKKVGDKITIPVDSMKSYLKKIADYGGSDNYIKWFEANVR